MNNETNSIEKQSKRRFSISIIIIITSVLGLTAVSSIALANGDVDTATIFTAFIGLAGTWVGTVLAFYFSKDNFDAATRSTEELIKHVTSADKLKSIKAEEIMFVMDNVNYLRLEESKKLIDYNLKDILQNNFQKYNRLPIITHDNKVMFMVHRSIIDRFITEEVFKKKDASKLSLETLINDVQFGPKISQSFACVKPDEELIIVKALMEKTTREDVICSDVFVTDNGTVNSPIVGWITNTELSIVSQV